MSITGSSHCSAFFRWRFTWIWLGNKRNPTLINKFLRFISKLVGYINFEQQKWTFIITEWLGSDWSSTMLLTPSEKKENNNSRTLSFSIFVKESSGKYLSNGEENVLEKGQRTYSMRNVRLLFRAKLTFLINRINFRWKCQLGNCE